MDFGLLITQKNLPQITSLKSLKESIKKELKASDPNKKIYGFGSQYRGKSILYRFMEWSYYYGLNEDKIFIHNNFENALKGIADLRKEINEILPSMFIILIYHIITFLFIFIFYFFFLTFFFFFFLSLIIIKN